MNESYYHYPNWSETLFIQYPKLFLPFIEKEKVNTQTEVNGLCSILNKSGVRMDARILDLSCGIGRHTLELAARGFTLVGYDPSRFFLDIAKERFKNRESNFLHNVKFYEGKPTEASEILLQHNEQKFDAIINMWHSFGYKTVEEDLKMFRQLVKIAFPNCLLIIDAQNRDWTVRHFQPVFIHEFEDLMVHETWKFNFESRMIENVSKFYEKDPNNGNLRLLLTLPTFTILYSLHELIELLDEAGWKYITSYGSFQSLEPLCLDSRKIVALFKLA